MELLSILLVALMIEAVVETVKPLWKADGKHLTAAEIVSILIGMLVAVTCKINMLAPFVALDAPVWVEYIFYALTGIALGRGPSFVHDLWTKINEWSNGNFVTETVQTGVAYLDDEDLNIENWSLPMLRSFCASNGIPCAGCTTRQDYMDAIENWGVTVPAAEEGLKDPETPKYTDPDAYLMRETGNPPTDGAE